MQTDPRYACTVVPSSRRMRGGRCTALSHWLWREPALPHTWRMLVAVMAYRQPVFSSNAVSLALCRPAEKGAALALAILASVGSSSAASVREHRPPRRCHSGAVRALAQQCRPGVPDDALAVGGHRRPVIPPVMLAHQKGAPASVLDMT